MRHFYALLLITLFHFSLSSQAELVMEFVPGSDGTTVYTDFSGTYNQATSVKLSESLILFSAKGALGQELYKIDNGEVSVVRDLMTGAEDSDPEYLTVYNGMAYFIAEGDEGGRIYKTDGTEGGTQIAFELGDADTKTYHFSEFLIGRDGRLYFAFDGSIYTYDNSTLTKIEHSNTLSAGGSFNQNDYKWALYKEGVLVLDVNEGELFLLSIIDNQVEELATAPYDDGFDRQFAVESFEGGVFFSLESFDSNVEGDYVYKESTGTVKRISDGGYHRSEYIDEKSCVVSGFKGATYLFNADHKEGIELNNSQAFSYAGGTWERNRLSNGLLYVGAGGTFDDTEIYFIARNSNTAELVHTTDDMSRMKTDGSYTFYFAESELGDSFEDEDLFAFNHTTQEVSPIKTLFDTPFNTSITPLGVIDQELYFFGIMDNEVGLELYKLGIGFNTSTNDFDSPLNIALSNFGNGQFRIESEPNEELNIAVMSVDGRLLEEINVGANTVFEVRSKGMVLISVETKKGIKTFKIFN